MESLEIPVGMDQDQSGFPGNCGEQPIHEVTLVPIPKPGL